MELDNNDDDASSEMNNNSSNNDDNDSSDVRISSFDSHRESSVEGIAWSACDAWLYMSLSYDGTVQLNHVPTNEKYKILL
jgi:hypothetical protein